MARKTYTCPYCFFQFENFEIKKSKSGKAEHKHCPNPETDTDGHSLCNHYLPEDFVDHDATTIAIYGGKNAGKSTFIASLVKFLTEDKNVRNYLKIHASYLEEDDHSKKQIERYWKTLVNGQGFPDASDSSDATLKKPIVLSIKNIVNHKQTYLTFFDTPGEEFDKMSTIVDDHPHICNADAILFFIDPLQIESTLSLVLTDDVDNQKNRFYEDEFFEPVDAIDSEQVVKNLYSAIRNTWESKLNSTGQNDQKLRKEIDTNVKKGGQMRRIIFNKYIQDINEKLGNVTKSSSAFRVSRPTAFCISKYDLLAGLGGVHYFENIRYTDDEQFLASNPTGNWIVSILEEIKDGSKRIHDFLQENEAVLFQEIDLHFSNYKIIGVAAAIAEDSDISKVKLKNLKPVTKNLLHPLIWVLNELKFFK